MMFDTTDLANMREAFDDRLQDSCYLQALTETTNGFNEVIDSWADSGSELPCGLEMKEGSEQRQPDKTVVQYDAVLRLAIAQLPAETKRVRVTKRYGESITPLIFDIVSPAQRGPAGLRVLLNKVST